MASAPRLLRVWKTVARRGRSFVSQTRSNWEQHVLKVPTMGDSITEGTIVEWTAKIGQAVKEEDVVALVETDKVTVEIKAERDGVITEQFGNVDDTVEVGANLYTIDTDATPTAFPEEISTAQPSAETIGTTTAVPADIAAEPVPATAASSTHHHHPPPVGSQHRTPMIHFLGKDGWEARRRLHKHSAVEEYIPPMYGRPKFTEQEMEALMLGGASLAPEVTQLSSGAAFK